MAEEIGFKGVMAGPLVRSSYRAGRLWAQAMERWGRPIPEHLAHLAEAADAPARQEAASLVEHAPARRILTVCLTRMARKEDAPLRPRPKKPGRLAQIRQVFTALTRRSTP